MDSRANMSDTLDLSAIFDELYPLCRSITGSGTRRSLEIIGRHMPLEIVEVESGTQVFDWTVPPQWEIESATLTGPDGETVVDFADHNLHVLNYSEPVDEKIELAELQKHLHSLPAMPDAIPYVTSYYAPKWGFCLTDRQRKTLKPGTYHAKIDSKKFQGHLTYGVAELKGETDELVLITSYVCHPSLANNELSGPLGLLSLYHKIAQWPKRRYTYRFLLIPETIGSICYLAAHGEELRQRLKGGAVLTCLGGHSKILNFKLTRADVLDQPYSVDHLARHLADVDPQGWKVRQFTPTSGSDERQFCSPGFNLPMVQIARTVYGQYDEYHTSLDTKEFMRIERVEDAAVRINQFFMAFDFEGQTLYNLSPNGEPNLGKRGLYPSTNSPLTWRLSSDTVFDARQTLNQILQILSYSDGNRDLRGIAEIVKAPVTQLVPVALQLESHELVQRGARA